MRPFVALFAFSVVLAVALPLAAKTVPVSEERPPVGVLLDLIGGDLMCYADIRLRDGSVVASVPATFEVCDKGGPLIGLPARFHYSPGNVADCEGIEPCGRSRVMLLLDRVQEDVGWTK